MKRLFLLLLSLLPMLTGRVTAAETTLQVSGDADFFPYEYLDEEGQPRGFNVDVFRAVAAELHYKVEITLLPWTEARTQLETGQIDALMGMYYSPERARLVDFCSPHLTVHHSQFLHRRTPYRPLELQREAPVALQKGDLMDDELKKMNFKNIIYVDSPLEGLEKVSSGEARIFIGGKLQGLYLLQRNNIQQVRAAGPPMKAQKYGMAVPKGREALRDSLNEGLAMIKASGEYNRLYERHFGHLSDPASPFENRDVETGVLFFQMVLLALSGVIIAVILHKKLQQSKTLSKRLVELERADQNLRQSQQQFDFLTHNIKEVFYIISLDVSSIYYVSPGFEQIWGFSVEDAYRQPQRVFEAIPEPEKSKVLLALREEGSRSQLSFQLPLHRPDGRIIWVNIRSYPVFDTNGTPYRLTGFIEDCTEQKKAADRKERMTNGLRQVVTLTSELLQCSNPEVLYRRSVELMREKLGLERCGLFIEAGDHVRGTYGTDMKGQTTDEHEYIDPKWATWEEDLKAHQKDRQMWFRIEREHTQWEAHKTAVVGRGWVVITPIFASDGQPLGVITNDCAISRRNVDPDQQDLLVVFSLILGSLIERLRNEANMHQLRVDLEKARKMESIGLLAGGVAHDLNNILGPIVGYPELIKTMLDPDHPAQADLDQIKNSARQAASVIQDLLHMARKGHIKPVLVNVYETVQNFVKSAAFADSSNLYPLVNFRLIMDESVPTIMGTEHHLHQILLNLINNAFEACAPKGNVTLTVAAADGPTLLMRVEDNGPGIDPHDLEHIFEPFYSRKQLGRSGSGLGLSVVYGIIQDLKGSVEVRSEPGRGCRFSIRFEAVNRPAEPVAKVSAESRGRESILVVDDLVDQQQVARRILTPLGYTVYTAQTIEQAVRRIQEHPCELAVMDMLLSDGENGLEALQALRHVHPNLKCVVVSGFAEHETLTQMQTLGVTKFVTKPYEATVLAAAIREELDCNA